MSMAQTIALIKALGSGGGGGGGGALVVNVTEVDGVSTCDKTAGEMWDAYQTGVVLIKAMPFGEGYEEINLIFGAQFDSESSYNYMFNDTSRQYKANTADDYPASSGLS